jgi:hypothetical protein
MGYSAEFGQRYGPRCSIIDHIAESYELHLKACRILYMNKETTNGTYTQTALPKACTTSFERSNSALWATMQNEISIRISRQIQRPVRMVLGMKQGPRLGPLMGTTSN